jgi:hypothetical protein
MRSFIIFIFLTFVVLNVSNAAPQSAPTTVSPIEDKSVLKHQIDDFFPLASPRGFRMQFGGLSGAFNDNPPSDWHLLFGMARRTEFKFERAFIWGASLASNESLELKLQSDFSSLFLMDPMWNDYGIGVSQFLWGRDGVSNLVNINQSKINIYADFATYFQVQAYYGLKGLAYSISLQSWF